MPKFHVQEPIRHDGKDYAVGAAIDLEADVAEGLVASGVVIDSATFKAQAKAKVEAESAEKQPD